MRPILLSRVERTIPKDWRARARAALEDVNNAPETDRAEKINAHQDLWKELKEFLRNASYGKCWYCESIDDRSDNAVDHFRPKNRVAEAVDPKHSGYWWLAFDWRNYRFCCTYCNSYRRSGQSTGGKQDHFPLFDESKRAKCADEVIYEQPMLLDPTHLDDVAEITFDDDGQAVPVCTQDKNTFECERATLSIKFYHLNESRIVERRAVLMQKIRNCLESADSFFKKLSKDPTDCTARQAYNDLLEWIYERLLADAEYSAAARATVGSRRGTSGAADALFSRVPC